MKRVYFAILLGIAAGMGVSAAQATAAEKPAGQTAAVPLHVQVPIGLSRAMPLVGQAVTVSVEPTQPPRMLVVVYPDGSEHSLQPDAKGEATWTPARYGKYVLRYGDATQELWALARPLIFHWWDARNRPRLATIVMNSDPYWARRGVQRVRWTGAGEGKTPEQRLAAWYKGDPAKDLDGMAIDEMYGDAKGGAVLAEGIALLRKKAGKDYIISVYSAGIELGFSPFAPRFRQCEPIMMIESYYGDDASFRGRWHHMTRHGLDHNTLFAIGPGFRLRPDCYGPLTLAGVCEEFARVRRVAPASPGIALYNAYSIADRNTIQPALDAACSQAIEDYFLKPVVAVRTFGDRLTAWNVGNEDAKDFRIDWLNAKKASVKSAKLDVLRPWEETPLNAPQGAEYVRIVNAAGTVNLYFEGIVALPSKP